MKHPTIFYGFKAMIQVEIGLMSSQMFDYIEEVNQDKLSCKLDLLEESQE